MNLWPFGIYLIATLLLIAGMLLLSYLLGERHRETATEIPYESGIVPTVSAQVRFSAKFYLVAMFFVIFDLEAVFIYAWAVAARELRWLGYGAISLFIGVLLAALIYLVRLSALDWGSPGWTSR